MVRAAVNDLGQPMWYRYNIASANFGRPCGTGTIYDQQVLHPHTTHDTMHQTSLHASHHEHDTTSFAPNAFSSFQSNPMTPASVSLLHDMYLPSSLSQQTVLIEEIEDIDHSPAINPIEYCPLGPLVIKADGPQADGLIWDIKDVDSTRANTEYTPGAAEHNNNEELSEEEDGKDIESEDDHDHSWEAHQPPMPQSVKEALGGYRQSLQKEICRLLKPTFLIGLQALDFPDPSGFQVLFIVSTHLFSTYLDI
jgi:hypothetical protein